MAERRGRERRAWRLIGWCVTALVLLTGGGTAWGAMAHRSIGTVRTYSAPVRLLELDADSAVVRIEAGPSGQATVQQHTEWTLRRPEVDQSLREGTLRITVRCRGVIGSGGCGLLLDIRVPDRVRVHARATSGALTVRGMAGEVQTEATSGQINLRDVSGPVRAKATSGQINGDALTALTVRAEVTSGQTTLGFLRPPEAVTVTTTSGQASLGIPADSVGYRITTRVTSGQVEIQPGLQVGTSPRTVDLSTTSGQIGVLRISG